MRKKELMICITIDNEFKRVSDMILNKLHENSIDHFVGYELFDNVCINMYVGIETKVVREKHVTIIKLGDELLEFVESIKIPNNAILTFKMEECMKINRLIW